MNKTGTKIFLGLLAAGLLILTGISCSTSGDDTAMLSFSLTDAPDTSGLTNVFITVSSIKVNEAADAADGTGGSWDILTLDPPKEFDLLTLANGVQEAVGELEVAGGTQINQIRFVVDSARVSSDDDATSTPLTVNSGSVKIVNSFQVPLSGTIEITLDFDVQKSVIKTGVGAYKLKPAIRAIVENEAGWITGTAPLGAGVYLYKDGEYVDGTEPTESDLTVGEEESAFPNAYTSAVANETTGTFKLAFLDPGTYDIVVQKTDGTYSFFDADLAVAADKNTAAGDLTF